MAGKKLLVADDSLTIQKVIRLALSNEGYEIQAVSDGNDAIQQISLFRPDAVLIDVSLPGKTAFEVKRAINEHSDLEEVRFILMSSAFEKVDEPQADEVKFHGRLTKPFDPAHLRQTISETLAQVAALRSEPTSLLQKSGLPSGAAMPAMPAFPSSKKDLPEPREELPEAPDSPTDPSIELTPGGHSDLAIDHEFSQPLAPLSPELPLAPTPPPVTLGEEEDWLSRPSALPPAAPSLPTSDDFSDSSWESERTLTSTPPPPSAPASIPNADQPDGDIKHLTESTIRMSGLDDFQWSVSEPSLKPPASFEIENPSETASGIPPFRPDYVPEISDVAEAAPDPDFDTPSLSAIPDPSPEVGAASPSDFYRDLRAASAPIPGAPPVPGAAPRGGATGNASSAPRPPAVPPMGAGAQAMPGQSQSDANVVGISSDQIEDLLRKELQKLLPDLAEKIIKQEIHKMLSDSNVP